MSLDILQSMTEEEKITIIKISSFPLSLSFP